MANATPWVNLLRLIENGMPVDAGHTNAPLTDLSQRTQHLKDLLSALSAGEALYIRSVPISSDVMVGQPVYLNTSTNQFEKALVALDYNSDGIWGTPALSSFCRGVVTYKHTATTADIVTAGTASSINISQALRTGETDTSGPYYLSATEAGKVERYKAPAAPFVFYRSVENDTIYVAPEISGGMTDHVHYKLQLTALPAGVPNEPAEGKKHSIVTPNSTLPGWLPATDSVFQGSAPAGAVFGYNIAKDPELAAVFPPLPLDSYFLEVFGDGWGSSREPDNIVKVDANGIWWMVDDFGWAPWSINYWDCVNPGTGVAGTVDADKPAPVQQQSGNGYYPYTGDACYDMSMYLWFTKLASTTTNSMVASLTPREGSAIVIKDCNWIEDRTSGHLLIDIDLNFSTAETLVAGGIVLKQVEGDKFSRGWVTEGIKSTSPVISISGEHTDANGFVQGKTLITYNDPNVNAKELDVLLTALNGVVEDSLYDVMYLGFRPGRDSSFRGKLEVSSAGFEASTDYEMNLVFWILGTAAGTLPNLEITYRRIPYSAVPVALPTAETGTFTLDLSGYTLTQNQYVEVASDAFDIEPGDTVFFTVSRTSSDTYSGNVGMLRQKGIINPKI
jgi:hypothetical protein